LATGVAILAMVAGFALASTAFLPFTSTTVNGNQGAISTANTIYSPGISGSWFTTGTAPSGSCESTAPSTTTNTLSTANAWVAGGAGACATHDDYVYQLNFTSANTLSAGPYTDTFTISSEFGGAASFTTESVSVVCTLSGADQCQADINIDSGVQTTSAQPLVGPIDVSVSGS